MKELNVVQMEEINGGTNWGCLFGSVAFGLVAGPIGAFAFGVSCNVLSDKFP